MSKDQAIGMIIFILCIAIAIFYIATLFFPQWLETRGLAITETEVRFWTIAIPVFIGFIAILGIGAWIGWTMATTPPPKPIEDITKDIEEKNEGQAESQN